MRRAAPWPLQPAKGDTVWMGAIDAEGRAVSFIQSVYWEFGSGCVLPRTGVLMQNRGVAFSLDPKSRNPLDARAAAVPHPQPAARRVRRRPRPRLWLDGRRRPAAVPGAGLHPLSRRRGARRTRSPRRAISSAAPGARRPRRVKLEDGYDECDRRGAGARRAIRSSGTSAARARRLRPCRRADARAKGEIAAAHDPALGRRRGGPLAPAAAIHETSSNTTEVRERRFGRGAPAY